MTFVSESLKCCNLSRKMKLKPTEVLIGKKKLKNYLVFYLNFGL